MKERSSKEEEFIPLPERSSEEIAELEAKNALLQYDLMNRLIDESISGKRFRLRPSSLMQLNRVAVQGLVERPGSLRLGRISISGTDHEPPAPEECAELVDDFCDYVNDNWESSTALHLAAYVMWRLNWIHPFSDGNGRTSRAISYLVLCAKLGHTLPGEVTIPELVAETSNRTIRLSMPRMMRARQESWMSPQWRSYSKDCWPECSTTL